MKHKFSFLILLVLLALIMLESKGAGAVTCDPSVGQVQISLPSGNTSAPLEIVASAVLSCPPTAIKIYLDGEAQWLQYRQSRVHVKLPASVGQHRLTVQAWNAEGKVFKTERTVFVTSVLPPACKSSFDLDNYVWVCGPADYERMYGSAWVSGLVRSDSSPLRETRITFNGVTWATALGATATQPSAWFDLPPGLYSVDIASSTFAGAEMHNGTHLVVRSPASCQPPVLSVLGPSSDLTKTLADPVIYLAAADAGRDCSITAMQVYVDGKLEYRAWSQWLLFGRLWTPPGRHQLTLQAWNNRGQSTKQTMNVLVEENLEGYCMPESDPGVMICSGEPFRVGLMAGVGTPMNPQVPMTAARLYVNGVRRADYYGAAMLRSYTLVLLDPGKYNITAVAWNAKGEAIKASEVLTLP